MPPWLSPLWLVPEKIVWFCILVFLEAHERNFRGTLAQYSEYCVLFLCELFAFACNAKSFTIAFLVFSLFLPVTDFAYISSFVSQDDVTRIRLLSLDALANVFVTATVIVKFRMCEYYMPCALEKIVITDLSALVMWSFKNMWQTKTIPSPLAEGLLPESYMTFLITSLCQITWQTETIISPLPQFLKPPNLVGWWLSLEGFFT